MAVKDDREWRNEMRSLNKDHQEFVKRYEGDFQEQQARSQSMKDDIAGLRGEMSNISATLERLVAGLTGGGQIRDGILGKGPEMTNLGDNPAVAAAGARNHVQNQNPSYGGADAQRIRQETPVRYHENHFLPQEPFNPAVSTARIPRIDFPGYDGTASFRSWKGKMEQYFEVFQTPELQKIRTVYFHLGGIALDWHDSFVSDKQDLQLSWPQYAFHMGLRFDIMQLGDPMRQLKELQHSGSIEEYHIEFERIRAQTRCEEAHALSMFLGGLRGSKLKGLVTAGRPRTMLEAYNLAKIYEGVLMEESIPGNNGRNTYPLSHS